MLSLVQPSHLRCQFQCLLLLLLSLSLLRFWPLVPSGFSAVGKKGSKAPAANGASDWQRQAAQQPGSAGSWNPQGGAPGGWNQQAAPGQAAGNWGQPAQQQQASWGAADAAGNWGQPAQQPGGWGAQPANSWNAGGNQPAPSNPLNSPVAGVHLPLNSLPLIPGAHPPLNSPPPIPGEIRAHRYPGINPLNGSPLKIHGDNLLNRPNPLKIHGDNPLKPANPWGAQAAQPSPQQGQQPQAAYGDNSSGPAWGQPAAPRRSLGRTSRSATCQLSGEARLAPVSSPPAGNSTMAQQGGFGPGTPGMMQDPTMFANNDGDKTMLRTTGPQGGLGFVQVEEGKEPGRVYEVRKEVFEHWT